MVMRLESMRGGDRWLAREARALHLLFHLLTLIPWENHSVYKNSFFLCTVGHDAQHSGL